MFLVSTCRICFVLLSVVSLLSLSACVENDSASDSGSSVNFAIPSILNTRAIAPEDLDPTVIINNAEVTMVRNGDLWTGSATVDKNSAVVLSVEWHEVLPDTTRLLLARASHTQNNVTSEFLFSVLENSYTSTGEGREFDQDGDKISNLEERKRGLNPLVAEVPTNDVIPDVSIFGTNLTTKIDGRQDPADTFWSFATYTDRNNQKLAINNLIRNDTDSEVAAPISEYQWAAIHDGSYLTIFIWGKAPDSTNTVNGDSAVNFFDDDSVEIYWDGDLSRLPNGYDFVDDMLLNIPLARGLGPVFEENNSSAVDKRIMRGNSVKDAFIFDEQNPALVEFGTCFCGGAERSTWEVRIDLTAAKIPVGRTFGFEIQINRDDDGATRDSKWAWAAPARQTDETNNEADSTWRFASRMGKARLIPFTPR